jgi:signal peptidase I
MENRPPLPPWGAVVLSSWVPGVGQMAAGHRAAGWLWLAAHVVGLGGLLWTAMSVSVPGFRATLVIGVVMTALWVVMLIHAHRVCPRPAAPGTTWPWIVGWLSYLLPGLGQLCCRQWWTGAGFLLVLVLCAVVPSPGDRVLSQFLSAASAFHVLRQHPQRRLALLTLGLTMVSVVLAFGVRTFIVQAFRVPTGAMAPTVQAGDHLFADKLVYRLRDPRRGEIVAFRTDSLADIPAPARGSIYIKRVVGLPGEQVSIRPPQVLIDGKPVNIAGIEYVLLPDTFPPPKHLKTETDSVLLGADEYFVLGDNSLHSMDSRFWGPVRRDAIIGRAVKIYWPATRAGVTFAD